MHLADLGAEVIKIEPPKKGDATRLIGLRPGFNDSGLHRRWNRGKKSVALDPTDRAGLDILRKLVARSDIVIEGLRPGTLAKMGLGWSELTALKPNLVVVALSGYGQDGPYRDMPSHGVGFDAVSGLAPASYDARGRSRLEPGHTNFGTILAPLFGATGALAALWWSRTTGRPVFLDIAQADAATFANLGVEDLACERQLTPAGAVGTESGQRQSGDRGRGSTSSSDSATMQYYDTRDGKVLLIMALERKFFVRLMEAVDRPDLVQQFAEDRYADPLMGSDQVRDALAEAISLRDRDEWMRIFAEADVPVVPVNRGAEVLDDPQLQTRIGWLKGDQGTVTMRTPMYAQPPLADPSMAAALGQDTASVLLELGIDADELERLEDAGVVRTCRDREAD
jgi:crotonobetainyl-CoA:carnitine CoA-transferase CaiB-like acyl-CoA transferase